MKYQYGDIYAHIAEEQPANNAIFVTGVTGFLGSHYVFWRAQLAGHIFVLVRAETTEAAWQRTLDALETCARSYNLPLPEVEALKKKITCIPGDVTLPDCGIRSADMRELENAGISEIWHCAASLSFLQRHRDRIINTNVAGTQTLLSIGKHIGIKRMVYISTAYTAGTLQGDIPESIHRQEQNYANCYEESKDMAEKAVVDFCEKQELEWTILRPSIVMGPLITQCSGGTRFGLYGLAMEVFMLRETLINVQSPLRLVGDEDCKVNMIPVDQVVFDMLYVESINFEGPQVYHLSNSVDHHLSDVIEVIEQNVGTNSLKLVDKRDTKRTSLEELFDGKTQFYSGYYKTQKKFLRSLPAHKPLLIEEFNNYMRNFIVELSDAEKGSIFNRLYVKSWDSAQLCVHTLGDKSKPTIVIANAFGMPVDFVTPLAKRLSHDFFVVTWDSRWVPGLTHEFDLDKCDSLTHAKDMLAILDALEIDNCSVVGWSSGVQVCLRSLSEFKTRINSAVLLNGGVSLKLKPEAGITEYEENIRSLLPKIGKSKRMAKLYCDLIYGASSQLGASDQKSIGTILTSTDPHLLYMTSMPFRTPEALYRYANMMALMFAEAEDAYTTEIEQPVLVYGTEIDEITHPDVARGLAEAIKNSELVISETDSHFAQFYERSVAQMVKEFVQKQLKSENNTDLKHTA